MTTREIIKMTIGTRIKAILKFKKIEQKELAKATGISETKMSRICLNKTKPTISNIEQIARYLNMTIDELLGHSKLFNELLGEFEGRLV